ncbi:hypothetical protein NPIL_515751 [Nephila pilipes]|uniref:Uncharacterized protein n=1 Tax=Nephila pilipes TaxID=299642 RepID=A0A8X6N7J5_NEPPI|nr:hypothetical protein NPIL_515751 [Nephila pilipes]
MVSHKAIVHAKLTGLRSLSTEKEELGVSEIKLFKADNEKFFGNARNIAPKRKKRYGQAARKPWLQSAVHRYRELTNLSAAPINIRLSQSRSTRRDILHPYTPPIGQS